VEQHPVWATNEGFLVNVRFILIGLLLIIVSVVPCQMLQDTIPAWSLCS